MSKEPDAFVKIKELFSKYQKLSLEYRKTAAEPKAEDYALELFKILGWDTLGEEVVPQKKIKTAAASDRVDYSFRLTDQIKPSMYVEVKKFARDIDNPEWSKQAVEYGKNGGARWTVLTNFHKIRVFNSDFYSDIDRAELFEQIDLSKDLDDPEKRSQILLLSRDSCAENKLDEYAKKHKKWRESADIEKLLTNTLLRLRKTLIQGIYDQNWRLYEESKNVAEAIDSDVQILFDRIIFSRILEDNGVDEDRKLRRELERWEKGDKRVQFYSEYIVPFFVRMSTTYDSNIFKSNGLNDLRIKNEDFVDALRSFYIDNDGLQYHFDAIPIDVLGHVYEDYLSYKTRIKGKTIDTKEEMFERKRSGVYFTPRFLVDYLVKSTLGKKLDGCKTPSQALAIRVLDPACGSGTFLIRAYDEFKRWYKENPSARQASFGGDSESGMESFLDAVMENCLYGIDIDPRASELTRLNLFIRAVHNPKILPKLHVISANSLITDNEYEGEPFVLERKFPVVHDEGGFDVIVTNPPWEKWKPNSKEFFEPHYPGFKALPPQEAKKVIQSLLSKRPLLKKQWADYNAHYEAFSELFRDKKNFQFQSAEVMGKSVSGDLDLYKLFMDKAYQLLKDKVGVAGMVVPSGIYTDLGAKGLRMMLFDRCKIESLYGFENRKPGLFPDVDSRYKPTLITFIKGKKTTSFPCGFFLHTPVDLENTIRNPTLLDVAFIKSANPNSWNIIEIKSKMDYAIVTKMLKHPHLMDKANNSWNISISRGFDMTNDSHLFQSYGKGVPMLEGKNMHQYTKEWKEAPKPKYSVLEGDVEANLQPRNQYNKDYWLAYRLIASSTNERTLICAIIPPGYVCGNSIAIVRGPNLKELAFLCGVLNSFVVDYLIRQKVSANVNMFYFLELPVPRTNEGQAFESIGKKVIQLTAVNNEYKALRGEVGMVSPVTEETDREVVKAKIDALVAKLYGITENEFRHILSQFPIVDNKIKERIIQEYLRP